MFILQSRLKIGFMLKTVEKMADRGTLVWPWLPKPVRMVRDVTGRNGPNWEDPPQNLRTF